MTPHVCPKCDGFGRIPTVDPGNAGCPACNATGIVWSPDSAQRTLDVMQRRYSPITKEGRERLERGGGPAEKEAPEKDVGKVPRCMCPRCGEIHIEQSPTYCDLKRDQAQREMTPAEREHRRIMATE